MKIAIITAMTDELLAVAMSFGIKDYFNSSAFSDNCFSCYGNEIYLIQSGMGFDNAARAAEITIEACKPELIISTGFCGAISDNLKTGDIVVAKTIGIANKNRIEEVPVSLSP
ncbi:MAG: hypothetical protein PHU01_15805, partial [Desulfuromonadaceae bacterium]|nr:hypothetical protein [Desulfuromonadaceae bacterium]